jgi:hypothetical protein
MGIKRMRGWLAVLLPVFVLRALIPVGFMPMVGLDHSIRLVICASYAPLPAALMDMPMDAGMDMSHSAAGHGVGSAPVHQIHGDCPYGSSPALGALPALPFAPSSVQRPAPLELATSQIDFFHAPLRAQAPRAPPVTLQHG